MVIFDKLNNNINISTKDNPKMSEEITINIDSCIKSEGDPDPKFTATVYAGGINANKRILYDYTLTREAGEAAGIYDITLESADYEKSYVISYDRFLPTDCDVTLNVSPGTLTITKSAAPVEPLAYDHPEYAPVRVSYSIENIWHGSEFDLNSINIDQLEDYLVSGYDLFNLDEQLSILGPTGVCIYIISDAFNLVDQRITQLTGGAIPIGSGVEYNLFFINNDFEYTHPDFEENNFQYIMYGDISYDNRNIFDTGIYAGKILSYYNAGGIPEDLPVELINIVYRYIIAIKFNGTGFNKIIYPYCRGTLSGMASGVKINLTSDTEYLGNCGLIFEESARENNKINIIVNTLGISSDESRQNILSIDLMLFPHTIKTFEFDVTDQLTVYPRGGIITVDIDEDL